MKKIDYPNLTKEQILEEEFKFLIKEATDRGYTIPRYIWKVSYEKENEEMAIITFPAFKGFKIVQKLIWKDEKTFKARKFQLTLYREEKEVFQTDTLRDIINYLKKPFIGKPKVT